MKIRSARKPVTPKGPTGASAVDPSRTGVLRRGMRRAVDARFRQLEREAEEVAVRYLGQSLSSPQDRIRGFMEWFDGRTEELLFSDDDWWLGPLEACYEKGIGTAFRPLPGQPRQLQEVMLREFVGRVSRRPVSGGGGLASFLGNSSNQPRDWRGRWTSSGGLTGYGGKAAMTSYRRLRAVLRQMRDGMVGSAKASEAASGIQAGLDRRLQKAFITAWREVRDSASRRFGSGADLSSLRKVFTEGLDTAFYHSAAMAGAVRGTAVRGGPVTKGDVRGLRASRDSLTSALSSTMEQAFAAWQTIVPTGNAEGSGRFLVNAPLRDVRGRFMSERVNLLATRLENELRGATTAMSQQVARELVSGIEKNLTPRQVARNIVKKVDGIGRTRAMVIANTELVRAHAEGQLDAMAEEGVERVTPAVEWTTAATPCNLCQPLRGIVVTIDEARGMIPRHPNCRCAWRDAKAFRPPSSGRRKLAKSSIEKAIVQSLREEGDVDFDDEGGWGAGESIGERRPITNEMLEFSRVINSGCGAGAPGHPGFLPGNVCGQRPHNPLPRVSQQDELRMEMALRKAAGGDTIREFISYSASEENVSLALLHSPQTVKDEKSVKYFKDNPGSIDSIQPLPLVIQFGGRMIIRDGNSRAVAAMESGRDSLKVRVVYVPDTGE